MVVKAFGAMERIETCLQNFYVYKLSIYFIIAAFIRRIVGAIYIIAAATV